MYEVTISADGYVDETFEFEMEKDKNYSGEQFTISPELAAGSARIVLNGTHSLRISTRICGEIRIKEMTCT